MPTPPAHRGAPLRLLHLSDLHFGRDTDPLTACQPLERDLTDREGGLGFDRLDYLVVTGDLTNFGQAAEFEQVRRFLDRLFERFGLSAERCLIVPGNHDLDWDVVVYDYKPARQVNPSSLRNGSFVKAGSNYLIRNETNYGRRFEAFASFYQQLLQREFPLDAKFQIPRVFNPGDRVQIIGLNSAWECDEHWQERASINDDALSRALQGADEQVEKARKNGDLVGTDKLLRLAAWHHPPTGGEQMVNDAYLEKLRKARIPVALHGHVHENNVAKLGVYQRNELSICGAGTFGAPATDRPESTPQLYNLLDISPQRDQIRVHTRHKARAGGAWDGWANWPDADDSTSKRTYYDIHLPSA